MTVVITLAHFLSALLIIICAVPLVLIFRYFLTLGALRLFHRITGRPLPKEPRMPEGNDPEW